MQLLKRLRLDKPKGFWRDDRAVTAMEFAFIGPLFFLYAFYVLETGAVLFTEYVSANQRAGSRSICSHRPSPGTEDDRGNIQNKNM